MPVLKFDKLLTVERDEIESLYSIRNLIKSYIENSADKRHATAPSKPISIAVFGLPGAGKSFAVKQIASAINSAQPKECLHLRTIEYNVSQFRSIDDLGDALTRVISVNNEEQIPLVFFDEFDCALNGQALAWLKCFLAPMQDGTFFGSHQNISMGRAVFVFAGGLHRSFEAFDPSTERGIAAEDRGPLQEHLNRLNAFKMQKGPDFVSRLRGHINILPIDSSPGETKHVIRRAFTLRGLIEQRKLLVRVSDDPRIEMAAMDEDIIYAFLTVGQYRHGTRSIEAILQMCATIDRWMEKASLPSRAQLNMHVNADEFFLLMYRSRGRVRSMASSPGTQPPQERRRPPRPNAPDTAGFEQGGTPDEPKPDTSKDREDRGDSAGNMPNPT